VVPQAPRATLIGVLLIATVPVGEKVRRTDKHWHNRPPRGSDDADNHNRSRDAGRRVLPGNARSDPQAHRGHLDSVGYTGGEVPNATERNHGTHAEAIEIIFDPARV
jgi:hypothetical protein